MQSLVVLNLHSVFHVTNVFVRSCLNSYMQGVEPVQAAITPKPANLLRETSFACRQFLGAAHVARISMNVCTLQRRQLCQLLVPEGHLVQRSVRCLEPACCKVAESARRLVLNHCRPCPQLLQHRRRASLGISVHRICRAAFTYSSAARRNVKKRSVKETLQMRTV